MSFESKQASSIAAACRKEGLNVVEKIDDTPRFLPTNEITNMALIIEDDHLAKQVYKFALQNGITVRHIED
ncbi:hypothetical protein [Undibacterium umbellatum]|uniref:Uncharacterized protein n=1 Tax=Undibacterium umbellatum TaxID=2762300 RepID=A0ABR6ZIR0_9BURK|nr:hypothetical protein [Undibacterium umbellatum]MBC3911563.1 hypothetical protein [Undibacterium umbellatum]